MSNSKTNSRIFGIVFIFALFISAFCIAAKAEAISTGSEGHTITVTIKPDDKPIENIQLKLFKIAEGKDSGSYTVSEKFKLYSPEYNFLDSSTFDALVSTLEGYISADSIKPDFELSTDAEGTAFFGNLSEGAYLLTGDVYSDDTVTVTPSSTLVFLPFRDDDGEVNKNAVINLKYTITRVPSPAEKLSVYKVWKDNDDSARPTEVKVSLYQDGKLFETVTLNKSNNWRHQWENLPADQKWTVAEENVPKGYTATVNRNGDEFIVTNTKEVQTPTTTPGKTLPQTGLLWWPVPLFAALGIALVIAGVVIFKKKKREK